MKDPIPGVSRKMVEGWLMEAERLVAEDVTKVMKVNGNVPLFGDPPTVEEVQMSAALISLVVNLRKLLEE